MKFLQITGNKADNDVRSLGYLLEIQNIGMDTDSHSIK